MRKVLAVFALAAIGVGINAAPASACAGLVTPGGNVKLLRTATLAAHHDGVEHYITSFSFQGGGAEFGSIVPLPAIPTKVERGGDWTLQRLERETQPQVAFGAARATSAEADSAEVIYETRIDALDITILRGGTQEVGKWALDHGFRLTPDAPEVLDFYTRRSKIFMAARFNADAARERGQTVGEGTPIHLTMPMKNPWVPLRVLGLGLTDADRIDADVYLLTDRRPALLPAPGKGYERNYDAAASESLLNDLRSDKGMEWVPSSAWLTYLRIGSAAPEMRYDLATNVHGGQPSYWRAGLTPPPAPTTTTAAPTTTTTLAPTTTVTAASSPDVTLVALPAGREGLDAGLVVAALVVMAAIGTMGALSWRTAFRSEGRSGPGRA